MKNHNLFLTPNYRYRLPESNLKKLILSLIVLLSFVHVAAQNNINISGTVVDDQGEAVIGASVVAQKSKNGTITDVEGNFKLSVRSNDVLTISFIGYITQTVPVSGKNNIVVTLKENSMLLDEVVVTGFGLAQKKASVTGAISSVGAQELAHAKSVTATGALVGKLPGVNFRQDNGRPGAAPNIQIRNMGTPLIIIDGVQKDSGNLNNLDFNDIESVSVLKDASAAIYGMQAANGVVVITTKRGQKNQKLKVNVNGYYGWQLPSNYPKPASAEDYLAAIIQTETINGTPRTVTKEEYQKWVDKVDEDHTSFDWYKYIWVSAPQSYVNANVSGGTEKVRYYLSLGHIDQEGNIRGFKGFNRTNMQSNIDIDITNRFKVGVAINGRIETTDNPGLPGDDYNLPIYGAYNNLPTKKPYANNNPKYPAISAPWAQDSFGWMNYEHAGSYKDQWKVIQINGTAEYEILKGLKARGLFSYWLANRRQSNREYSYKFYEYDKENDVYNVVETGTARYTERSMEMKEELTSNIQLSYENTFALHHVNAVVGFEAKKGTYPRMYALGNPPANGIPYIDKTSLSNFTDGIGNPQTRMGYIGRLNYDYANKYIIELSGRYDGSYRYKRGKRWGFFPSGGLGWVVSNEKFWADKPISKVVNMLKLKGSYGLVGNDNISNNDNRFFYLSEVNMNNSGRGMNFGTNFDEGYNGISISRYANPKIGWEISHKMNVGFELKLFNDLEIQAEYFKERRTNILQERADIPSLMGFQAPIRANIGEAKGQGVDISLDYSHIFNKNLWTTIRGNFTYASSEFSEYEEPDYSATPWRSKIGSKLSQTYGYIAERLFVDDEDVANSPKQQFGEYTAGDIKYKDINRDGIIDEQDIVPIGYPTTPEIIYGFGFSVGYKAFDFNCFFQGSARSSFFISPLRITPFAQPYDPDNELGGKQANNALLQVIADNHWSESNQNMYAFWPRLSDTAISNNNQSSTWWLRDGTFLRMKSAEIGYTLPKRLTSKAKLENLRIYVSGTNLFNISKFKIWDTEMGNNGLGYPVQRVFNVGIQLSL